MWSSTKGAKVIPLICPFKLNIDLSKAFVEEPFSTFSYLDILCPFKCERESNVKLVVKMLEAKERERFYEYICLLLKRRNMLEEELMVQDLFTNKVNVKLDMFCANMEHEIVDKGNRTLVV